MLCHLAVPLAWASRRDDGRHSLSTKKIGGINLFGTDMRRWRAVGVGYPFVDAEFLLIQWGRVMATVGMSAGNLKIKEKKIQDATLVRCPPIS